MGITFQEEHFIKEGKMHTIFTVQPYDLERLNPKQAVDFFRELLWAEAARIGIGINKINISSHVDVADGGIDASIRDVDGSIDSGFIKTGLNCYQIKAGSSFIPWQESQIEKELFGKKKPGKEHLGKSIKDCLDNHVW